MGYRDPNLSILTCPTDIEWNVDIQELILTSARPITNPSQINQGSTLNVNSTIILMNVQFLPLRLTTWDGDSSSFDWDTLWG